MKANEIDDCGACPFYNKYCSGGVTGGPNGPKYPPCCNWNPDDEITAEDAEADACDREIETKWLWKKEQELKAKREQKNKRNK
jgi:hypothetical protein